MVPGSLTEDRVNGVLDSAPQPDALIRLQEVEVTYPLANGSSKKVLHSINLDIGAGEFVSVIGQTGCGKSTLLRLILGAERPTHGHVVVEGSEVVRPDCDRGYVPQKYSLFPDKTVLENITFGPEVKEFTLLTRLSPRYYRRRRDFREEALRQMRRMGLHESDAGKYPDQLSGGMQQRVAIAQALAMRPKILLMDEAFSALDPGTRAGMQRLIRSASAEMRMTVLFVTHNTEEAIRLGTRILVLAKQPLGTHGPRGRDEVSQIALDLGLPDRDQSANSCRTEEFSRLVQAVETATGVSSCEESENG